MNASKRAQEIRRAAGGGQRARMFQRLETLKQEKRTGHQEQAYRDMVLEVRDSTRERVTFRRF